MCSMRERRVPIGGGERATTDHSRQPDRRHRMQPAYSPPRFRFWARSSTAEQEISNLPASVQLRAGPLPPSQPPIQRLVPEAERSLHVRVSAASLRAIAPGRRRLASTSRAHRRPVRRRRRREHGHLRGDWTPPRHRGEPQQAFPDSYRIDIEHNGKPLSKTAQIELAGNSVCPPVAAAIVRANVCARVSAMAS